MNNRPFKPPLSRGPVVAIVAALAAVLLAGCGGEEKDGRTTIRLDPGERHQTVDGWAVFPRYWEHDKENDRFDNSYARHADAISRYLVDEVGINGARVEIWSGLENPVDHWKRFFDGENSYREDNAHRFEKINDNDDPRSVDPAGFQYSKFDYRLETMVLPIKRAVEANGERLHVNVNYVDFRYGSNQGSLSHADNPQEFAEFVLVYFERLRDRYGIVPDAFEIVLEPENTERWGGEQIARGALAVKARLAENGFHPEIAAPSAATMPHGIDYFDRMGGVPGALAALDTFVYHRYGPQGVNLVERIRYRARRHGLKTAMLEKIGAGIDELMEDLTAGGVSSWQQWAVAGLARWEDEGAFYLKVDMSDADHPSIEMADRTRQLAQLFRHVRRGAVRIGATSSDPDKSVVAFVDPGGGFSVVIRARDAGGPLTIEGMPAGRYGLRFTGERGPTRALGPVSVAESGALDAVVSGPGTLVAYALPGTASNPSGGSHEP